MSPSTAPHWIQYGVPTLDRPFGVQLWPMFETAYASVLGYKPQDFRFVPGETPVSTLKACTAILLSYYLLIFGGRELMRDRQPLHLNFLFKAHNFALTAISFVLLVLFVEQLVPMLGRHGVFFAICDHRGGWTDKMVILYYVRAPGTRCTPASDASQLNYLTKFVELFDTCFLFLKKKPLSTDSCSRPWSR